MLSPESVSCAASQLQSAKAEPWSWCGDSMDYDMALFALASQTRANLQGVGPAV